MKTSLTIVTLSLLLSAIVAAAPDHADRSAHNQSPVASFTHEQTECWPSLLVEFDASSSTDDRAIVAYHWDFGDGRSLTTRQPVVVHEYFYAGQVIEPTVVLTVEDSHGSTGSASATFIVAICPPDPEIP